MTNNSFRFFIYFKNKLLSRVNRAASLPSRCRLCLVLFSILISSMTVVTEAAVDVFNE